MVWWGAGPCFRNNEIVMIFRNVQILQNVLLETPTLQQLQRQCYRWKDKTLVEDLLGKPEVSFGEKTTKPAKTCSFMFYLE